MVKVYIENIYQKLLFVKSRRKIFGKFIDFLSLCLATGRFILS